MIIITRNQFYELVYSPAKNRIYFTIRGYWRNPEQVPDFFADWQKALQQTQPGFTVLADLQEMITHPVAVKEMHFKVASSLLAAGISYIAEVSPIDKIAVLQTSSIIKENQLNHIKVHDKTLGETILDQLTL
ncbi:hypothetical protein [Adhaeribacter soli]|uniref:STAS/SEC14 domain-containing protein n=1 Tax=Adhaeribacter soli TaxID=2607655 RepID=A0A5N1IU86_9BACT|nr:hypothetical protein [Adhaeribacter soli]KAA9331896.1 hypothetical protein F0P94_13945 [Adhaeribacter soli]